MVGAPPPHTAAVCNYVLATMSLLSIPPTVASPNTNMILYSPSFNKAYSSITRFHSVFSGASSKIPGTSSKIIDSPFHITHLRSSTATLTAVELIRESNNFRPKRRFSRWDFPTLALPTRRRYRLRPPVALFGEPVRDHWRCCSSK